MVSNLFGKKDSREDEKIYMMIAGKTCPICGSYGLFFVGDKTDEAEGVEYRCETCLTRFDSEKRAASNSFITENGLDEDRIQAYFGRWDMDIEAVKKKLEVLYEILY